MKATDLMIGDWVRINYRNKVAQVTEIVEKAIGTTAISPLSEGEFEPIPLTPEILEKNGFDISDPEVAQYHFTENRARMHFSLRRMYDIKTKKPKGYSFWAFNVLAIVEYVHTLQHALKLCGIDKEITL